MSELTVGNLQGMLSNADFYERLATAVDLAESQGATASFVVRKNLENPRDPKLSYPSLMIHSAERPSKIDWEVAQGNLGLLATSRTCSDPLCPRNALTPLRGELEANLELGLANPGIVHGVVAPHFIGVAMLLLYRESPSRPLIPERLDAMPAERNLDAARDVMHAAGINSIVLNYNTQTNISGKEMTDRLFS